MGEISDQNIFKICCLVVQDLYHLKASRLMIVVMPYPSNPCKDSQAKRGQAISCYLNFLYIKF